jgi:hypothetical protein
MLFENDFGWSWRSVCSSSLSPGPGEVWMWTHCTVK